MEGKKYIHLTKINLEGLQQSSQDKDVVKVITSIGNNFHHVVLVDKKLAFAVNEPTIN
ncbi:MAG: hypothetical protein HRU34_07750 [Richelia sp.]|nr:hypothetical protein [Richelia sp.]